MLLVKALNLYRVYCHQKPSPGCFVTVGESNTRLSDQYQNKTNSADTTRTRIMKCNPPSPPVILPSSNDPLVAFNIMNHQSKCRVITRDRCSGVERMTSNEQRTEFQNQNQPQVGRNRTTSKPYRAQYEKYLIRPGTKNQVLRISYFKWSKKGTSHTLKHKANTVQNMHSSSPRIRKFVIFAIAQRIHACTIHRCRRPPDEIICRRISVTRPPRLRLIAC